MVCFVYFDSFHLVDNYHLVDFDNCCNVYSGALDVVQVDHLDPLDFDIASVDNVFDNFVDDLVDSVAVADHTVDVVDIGLVVDRIDCIVDIDFVDEVVIVEINIVDDCIKQPFDNIERSTFVRIL